MIGRTLFLILALCGTTLAGAQRVIKGTVYDEEDNPLIGAKVYVQDEKSLKAVTDINGRYSLSVPHNNAVTLLVSFIGYREESERIKAGGDVNKIFYLVEDDNSLNEVVVTGTRTPRILKDAPILTRVISSEDIEKSDATNIADLLQSELPGIEFSYSMDQQTSLNMSGFGGNAILFLIDGERVAGETLNNIDYSRLTLDNVERVEIVKGAASSLYGSNAVGGVINLISKKAKKSWSANLNGRIGAHDDQRYGVGLGAKSKYFNNSFNAQFHKLGALDLERDGDYNKIYGSESYNFKDRLIYSPMNNLKFTAKAGYFFKERDSSPTKHDRYRDFNAGIKGDYDINDKNSLELSYTFDQYDKSDYNMQARLDVRDYSNVQHNVRALYNYNFSDNNYLTVGSDYMRDYLMSYQFENGGSHKQYTADAFAQIDYSFGNFNVIGALRYDYFSESSLSHVSPKLGIMYKFDHGSLRASYASGFRAPTLKEMYMSFDMANIFMIYGNEDLDPEYSDNFLITGEYNLGRYNFTLSGFYNLVDDRITIAWDKGRDGMVYCNMKTVKIAGVDANASVKYPCGIGARLSYVYTHEHIKKGEPVISTTRPHTATARIDYDKRWKNYGFNVSLSGRFLSELTCDEYDSGNPDAVYNSTTYPAYTIWNLRFTQSILKGLNISVNVDNLFNYRPDYYYNNSPSTTGTTCSVGVCVNIDEFF